MSSNGFPDRQSTPATQATYIWQRVDPRHNTLIRKKLGLAVAGLREDIKKESATIRFSNRLNLNRYGVEMAFVTMWSQKIEEHAEKCYENLLPPLGTIGREKDGRFC